MEREIFIRLSDADKAALFKAEEDGKNNYNRMEDEPGCVPRKRRVVEYAFDRIEMLMTAAYCMGVADAQQLVSMSNKSKIKHGQTAKF